MFLKNIYKKIMAFSILWLAICIANPYGYAQKNKKVSSSKKRSVGKKKKTTSKKKNKVSRFSKTYKYPSVIYLNKKDWLTNPGLQEDSAASIANYLLVNDTIFINDWSNSSLFINKKIADLPDEINLPLLSETETFRLTWYGRMNSVFGNRWGKQHEGLDLHLNFGDSVVSAFDGIVRYAKANSGGYGNCIVIRHKNGLETLYGHLSNINIAENQFVKSGQFIGLGGSTGHSTGPHLHFETRYKGNSFDPQLLIDLSTQELKNNIVILDKSDLIKQAYQRIIPLGKKSSLSKYKKGRKAIKKKPTSKKKKSSAKKTPAKKKPTKKKR